MTTQAGINDFLAQRSLAVVGVSRNPNKYGNKIFRQLKASGYEVYAINFAASTVEGQPCYPNLAGLPVKVGGVVSVVPPEQTRLVADEAIKLGIRHIWIQPGAESDMVVKHCEENELNCIAGMCLLTL
ncbi:MAG TPA: CoA-binding protein [Anaerolineaceae bacterium]|nr:CoA-binding protein [Anaerolineaceae bacterium]